MTYLQIVNAVLRLLREDEVASVSTAAYSKVIGDLVNQAKDEIEAAWRWNVLRNTITVNTVSGTFRYILTGAGTKSTLLDAYNDTQNCELIKASATWLNRAYIDTPQSGSPYHYGINGSDSSGDIQIDVYPKPDAVYNLDFNLVLKQSDLSSDSDIPLIPSDTLILGAWALAVSERGEDGGAAYNEIDSKFRLSLSDAIAIDASNMHSEDTTWCAV